MELTDESLDGMDCRPLRESTSIGEFPGLRERIARIRAEKWAEAAQERRGEPA